MQKNNKKTEKILKTDRENKKTLSFQRFNGATKESEKNKTPKCFGISQRHLRIWESWVDVIGPFTVKFVFLRESLEPDLDHQYSLDVLKKATERYRQKKPSSRRKMEKPAVYKVRKKASAIRRHMSAENIFFASRFVPLFLKDMRTSYMLISICYHILKK